MSFATDIAAADADCLDEFGEDVIYTPAGGAPVSIRAVFDEFYVEEQLVDGHYVQQTGPAFTVAAEDVEGAGTEGDKITRDSVDYYITGIQPSGNLVVLKASRDATPEAQ